LGEQVEHHREKFLGDWAMQVFMHYVDAQGSNIDQAYDGAGQLKYPKEIYKKWF